MENLEKRKKALRSELIKSIVDEISDTVFNIKTKNEYFIMISSEPILGLPFSPGEFAIYQEKLVLFVGFGKCRCSSGKVCEQAEKDAPTMFVLMENNSGITSVFKGHFSEYKKI